MTTGAEPLETRRTLRAATGGASTATATAPRDGSASGPGSEPQPGAAGARSRRGRRSSRTLAVVEYTLKITAALILAFVCVAMVWNQVSARMASRQAAVLVGAMDAATKAEELAKAREYNAALASDGGLRASRVVTDPYSETGAPWESDDEYLGLLNIGKGLMGSVVIPSISVDLPIYHGTSDATIASGAGHLYGTSLPVGGTGSNAVLTSHRGLTTAMLFTRVDELAPGDQVYVRVLDEVLTYQVATTAVVDPNAPDEYLPYLAPAAGRDLLTLVTCTPLGVNSHRLVVVAERVDTAPGEAGQLASVTDWKGIAIIAVAVAVLAALIGVTGRRVTRAIIRARKGGRRATAAAGTAASGQGSHDSGAGS